MIGRIEFVRQGKPVVAEMADDGTWTCAVESVQAVLNSAFRIREYSPAHGERGHSQVHGAAAFYQGQVTFLAEGEELPEGAVH